MVRLHAGVLRSRVLSFALSATFSSGVPYTPTTAGDVNGDGLGNDRAFIFDPADAGTDANVRAGMHELMRSAPARARACLVAQRGLIADHNSCWTGWSHGIDVHTTLHLGPPIGTSAHRRLSVWIIASNVTAGLDYLLHGEAGLRGWGQPTGVDNRLLSVQGFDPVRRRFSYAVNPEFGRRGSRSTAQPFPFSLRIQLRMVVGVDRPLREFEEARDAMSNRSQAFSPENIRLHVERQLPNVAAEVLALNGPRQLYLSVEQARRLEELGEDYRRRARPLIDSLVAAVAIPPGSPPRRVTPVELRVLSQQAVASRRSEIDRVRGVLSADQWSALPAELRFPSTAFSPYPPERLGTPSGY